MEEKGSGLYVAKSNYAKYGRKHQGKYLVCKGNCYGCGNSCHMKMDFPMMKYKRKENSQVQIIAPNPDASMKNRFYDLCSRGDQKESLDVFIGMLQVFSSNVYALLYPGAYFIICNSFSS